MFLKRVSNAYFLLLAGALLLAAQTLPAGEGEKPVTAKTFSIRVLAAQNVEQKYLLLTCELTNPTKEDFVVAATCETTTKKSSAESTVQENGISLQKQTVSEEILVTPLWTGVITWQSGLRRIFQNFQVEFVKQGNVTLPAGETRPLDLKLLIPHSLNSEFLGEVTSLTVTCKKVLPVKGKPDPVDVLGLQIALSGDQLRQLLKP